MDSPSVELDSPTAQAPIVTSMPGINSSKPPLDQATILEQVRNLVLSGNYAPGTALSELRLSQHFDVSRTPIREALKQLQVEGLVEIRPKVGTFVREITRREIVEMFDVKESLEGLAVRLMARRGRTPELDVLETNVEASESAVKNNDSVEYARLVHEFHQTIVDGSDNHKLAEHYQTLMNQLAYHRLVLRSVQHPGRLAQSTSEHRRVLSLIKQKDAVGAESAMRDHVVVSAREALTDTSGPSI